MKPANVVIDESLAASEPETRPVFLNFKRNKDARRYHHGMLTSIRMIENCELLDQIRARFAQGDTSASMLRFIRANRVLGHRSDQTILSALKSYRRYRMVGEKFSDRIGANGRVVRQEIKVAIDEVEELGSLYALQKERIEGFRKQEKSLPIPLQHIDNSIGVAIDLLKASSSLKMDLGLNHRAPQEVDLNVEGRTVSLIQARYGNEAVTRVLADSSSRSKINSIFEKIITSPMLQAALIQDLSPPAAEVTSAAVTSVEPQVLAPEPDSEDGE